MVGVIVLFILFADRLGRREPGWAELQLPCTYLRRVACPVSGGPAWEWDRRQLVSRAFLPAPLLDCTAWRVDRSRGDHGCPVSRSTKPAVRMD